MSHIDYSLTGLSCNIPLGTLAHLFCFLFDIVFYKILYILMKIWSLIWNTISVFHNLVYWWSLFITKKQKILPHPSFFNLLKRCWRENCSNTFTSRTSLNFTAESIKPIFWIFTYVSITFLEKIKIIKFWQNTLLEIWYLCVLQVAWSSHIYGIHQYEFTK